MKSFKTLFLTLVALLFVQLTTSCGSDSVKGSEGDSCTKTSDCEKGLECIDEVCVGDDGNTGNTGDDGNTANSGDDGNTADSGDDGNTGNTGDTANSGDDGNTSDSGDDGNTANSGDDGNTSDSGDDGNTANSGDDGNTGDSGNSPVCGNGIVEEGEICDGNSAACPALGLGTEGTAECKEDCSGWVTASVCTKTFECSDKPDNSVWNSVGSYTQTWNGNEWVPAKSSTTYNETESTEECRFKCAENYSWDGSECLADTRVTDCDDKPANTEWNDDGGNGTYIQTWNGNSWQPVASTTYNETAGNCQFKCSSSEFIFKDNICRERQWSSRAPNKDWEEAKQYCNNLTESGYSDWRLPTISELRTLIKNCPKTATDGTCNATDSCLLWDSCWSEACGGCTKVTDGSYSKLNDTESLWSISEMPDDEAHIWGVRFDSAAVDGFLKTDSGRNVRCIR
ncbi:MAG: DUF1566 domain-containing protein [bacterium]